MDRKCRRGSCFLSRRARLMHAFLENAQQDPDFLLAERQLDREDRYCRQILAALPPADRNALVNYLRAADSLADATAAIAFFMGMAEGRKQKRRLKSCLSRGKV